MDNGESILFIDMSYYIFYRFYALRNWYKRSQEDELDDTIMENELFINKYHKLFKEKYKKYKKNIIYKIHWLYLERL